MRTAHEQWNIPDFLSDVKLGTVISIICSGAEDLEALLIAPTKEVNFAISIRRRSAAGPFR